MLIRKSKSKFFIKFIWIIFPLFLFVGGSLVVCYTGFQWIDSSDVLSKVFAHDVSLVDPYLKVNIQGHEVSIPKIGEAIGTIKIPVVNKELTVYYGWRDDVLKKGVGLDNRWIGAPVEFEDKDIDYTLSLPGNGGRVVVAGHRDTVFRELGDLKTGDEIILDLSYGTFTYKVKKHLITDENDLSILTKSDSEILTLSTCYPFWFTGNAKERYIVEADLESAVFKN